MNKHIVKHIVANKHNKHNKHTVKQRYRETYRETYHKKMSCSFLVPLTRLRDAGDVSESRTVPGRESPNRQLGFHRQKRLVVVLAARLYR